MSRWFSSRPPARDPVVLAGLGVIGVAACVTAYASVSALVETKKWRRLRKPFATFMDRGIEALKAPLEAVEFTQKFMHEISTIASGAAAMYELEARKSQRQAENQARADQAKAERDAAKAKDAKAKDTKAEARGGDTPSAPTNGKASEPGPERRASATFGPQPPPGLPVREPPPDDGTGSPSTSGRDR